MSRGGSATTMAKKESQNPSAVVSSCFRPSGRPSMSRHAPSMNFWISDAGGMTVSAEPVFQEALVDARQRLEVVERHALVHHVHGPAHQPELDDRAVVLDEARVGRAARGRE